MSNKLQPVRGTHDLLADDCRQFRALVDTAREVVGRYGYEEVMTPIFEFTGVFQRTLGDASDVVSKETYSFEDRGGEAITLRPEFTAGLARAFISHGLKDQTPLKWFYFGPAFRYERPQKGRQRQFHQIGTELLGVAEPLGDVEMIAMAQHVLSSLNLQGDITLELNTLGDDESRNGYRGALVEFLADHRQNLSEDSQRRLTQNPLRILDSKDEGDKRIIENAPSSADYFTPQAEDFFGQVRAGLDGLNIAYTLNPRLVRGLDYYCHTVFEFTTDALGAQNTVLAGGRYDKLIAMMDGPDTPGCGWAAGVERLALLAQMDVAKPRPVALIPMGEAAEAKALQLAQELRQAGVAVELGFRGNMSKRMKRANKLNASHAVMIGDDELQAGKATLRDLDAGSQNEVAFDALTRALSRSA